MLHDGTTNACSPPSSWSSTCCAPASPLTCWPQPTSPNWRELSTEYVSDELLKRHGDTVWRLRLREHWMYLLILLEFQSKDDRWMALRILTYTGLLFQELVRNEAPGITDGRLRRCCRSCDNGTEPWTATREMRELIGAAGPWLARFQPAGLPFA